MKKRTAPKVVAKSHIAVKNSQIHGRGVFVKKDIPRFFVRGWQGY